MTEEAPSRRNADPMTILDEHHKRLCAIEEAMKLIMKLIGQPDAHSDGWGETAKDLADTDQGQRIKELEEENQSLRDALARVTPPLPEGEE
jgi:hypothetical protein